jgi:predicted Zn-dependent peptidase
MPKSTQSIIYSYIPVDALESLDKRYDALLFSNYWGGSMSSVLFQEIREFRSLAYAVSAKIERPVWKEKTKKSRLITFMTTQSDKTSDALFVLDSLQRNMPFIPSNIETTRKDIYNEISGDFPMFRDISPQIANLIRSGYDEDPTKYLLNYLNEINLDKTEEFYNQNLKGKPVVYCIVGDAKKVNMKQLATYGRIISVKKKNVFKW